MDDTKEFRFYQGSFNILLRFLRVDPYTLRAIGIVIIVAARQARSVPAHCTLRFSNICTKNKRKLAARAERSMILAATAEATLVQVTLSAKAIIRLRCMNSKHLQRQVSVNKIIEAW